jgi:hypothetical protein
MCIIIASSKGTINSSSHFLSANSPPPNTPAPRSKRSGSPSGTPAPSYTERSSTSGRGDDDSGGKTQSEDTLTGALTNADRLETGGEGNFDSVVSTVRSNANEITPVNLAGGAAVAGGAYSELQNGSEEALMGEEEWVIRLTLYINFALAAFKIAVFVG